MGSPKALLPYGTQTFLGKISADYRRVGCQPVIAVAGTDIAAIRASLSDSGVVLLRNPDPARGPFSSLKIAIKSLPQECRSFFVHPVDHPAVNLKTLRRITAGCKANFRGPRRPSDSAGSRLDREDRASANFLPSAITPARILWRCAAPARQ
jgi:CTP:molybdopterin cytidylyltransferase MocA